MKRVVVHSAETDASIRCNQEVAQSVESYELPAVPLQVKSSDTERYVQIQKSVRDHQASSWSLLKPTFRCRS